MEKLGSIFPGDDTAGRRRNVRGVLVRLAIVAMVCTGAVVVVRHRAKKPAPHPSIVQICNDPALGQARVEWAKTGDGPHAVYSVVSVRSSSGSTDPTGWRLHYRPAPPNGGDPFAPDVVKTDSDIFEASFTREQISEVPTAFPIGTQVVPSLTCPDGACTFSPITGCSAAYNHDTSGAKVAIVGDSIIFQQELCGYKPPKPPDYCAVSLGERLRLRQARTYIESNSGQSFMTWLPVIREQAVTEPSTFVLAFGTNDAHLRQARAPVAERPAKRRETERAVNTALDVIASLSPKTCVILVTAGEKCLAEDRNFTYEPAYTEEARHVNAFIRKLAVEHAQDLHIELADFGKSAEAHCGPAWLTDPATKCDWFKPDQLHLAGLGNDARNTAIIDAWERCKH